MSSSLIQDVMRERAIRMKQKDQKIQDENDRKKKNEEDKKRVVLKQQQTEVTKFIEYVNNVMNSLNSRLVNEKQYTTIVFASCITNEFVDKSRDVKQSIVELGRLDEIKSLMFLLWDNIQNVANKNLTIKSEVDRNMVKNVEKKIQQIFDIFELGYVEFEVVMDDSKDLEYARALQKMFDNNMSDADISNFTM